MRITPLASLIVQFTVSPAQRQQRRATLKCSDALCRAVFGIHHKGPLPLPVVVPSNEVVQLALPTVVSEQAEVWCTGT